VEAKRLGWLWFSYPAPAEVLEKRLLKLKELGTFGISLTGGDAPYS
jgi:hypothetical protein